MIGDHQQLKPTVSTYELAKNFHLDVSLFERLILNGLEHVQLKEQHRMRPEISSIIRNIFYPELQDHLNVQKYSNIKGVHKNLYFIDHNQVEDKVQDSMSKINVFEAKFLIRLSQYLQWKGGYDSSKITILTTYLGQMMLIKSMNPQVNVQVVDNYQGEENDIILLSLVRSNEQGQIGYLSVQSRICVALSRAKMGMYIIGNMSDLCSKSNLWKSIRDHLQKQNMIGPCLMIQCPYHPNSQFRIENIEDFDQNECNIECGIVMNCQHKCKQICHSQDRYHQDIFKCQNPCEKTCPLGHPCIKRCSEPCHPCLITESKIFECGHVNDVPCPTNNIQESCKNIIEKTFLCGHIGNILCGEIDPKCQTVCDVKLEQCDHPCGLPCHIIEHENVHNKKCTMKCSRMKKNCFLNIHPCPLLCHQNCQPCDEIIEQVDLKCGHVIFDMKCSNLGHYICMKKCDKLLPCGTHKCKNYCNECTEQGNCPPCSIQIEKTLICGHIQVGPCQNDDDIKCLHSCSKKLSCGHPCLQLCYEPCDDTKCDAIIESTETFQCGHQGNL